MQLSGDGLASLLAIVAGLGSLWVAVRAQYACGVLLKRVAELLKRVAELEALTAAQADTLNAFADDVLRPSGVRESAFVRLSKGGVVRRLTGVLDRFELEEDE